MRDKTVVTHSYVYVSWKPLTNFANFLSVYKIQVHAAVSKITIVNMYEVRCNHNTNVLQDFETRSTIIVSTRANTLQHLLIHLNRQLEPGVFMSCQAEMSLMSARQVDSMLTGKIYLTCTS